MVDFSGIRRESEPTFFFFARALMPSFRHALEACQVTGWQIMTKREALAHLPEGFEIPEVRISPGAPRVERSVLAFVSYFHVADVARKFEELQYDADIVQWKIEMGRRAMKYVELDEKRARDPSPLSLFAPGSGEDKSQISGVRRGTEPTYFFFPRQYVEELAHYLDEHDVAGWEIAMDPRDILDHLPDGYVIPEVRLYPDGTVTEDAAVFVSYFDPADMERKLAEILSSEETASWNAERRERAACMQEYARKFQEDPPPFPPSASAEDGWRPGSGAVFPA